MLYLSCWLHLLTWSRLFEVTAILYGGAELRKTPWNTGAVGVVSAVSGVSVVVVRHI
jgi:hypothetical protein